MKYNADDIRTYQFQKAGMSGYKASDVDELLDQIARDYDEFEVLKSEFAEKIQVLADKINEYRNNEDSVKTAILHAQKTGDAIYNERKAAADEYYQNTTASADKILSDANEKADILINDAQVKARDIVDRSSIESQKILSRAQEHSRALKKETAEKLESQIAAYENLKETVETYKVDLLEACHKYIESIKNLPLKNQVAEKIIDNLNIVENVSVEETVAQEVAEDEKETKTIDEILDVEKLEVKENDSPTTVFNFITDKDLNAE